MTRETTYPADKVDSGGPIKVLYVNHMPVRCGAVQSLLLLLRSFNEEEVQPLILSPPGAAFQAFENAGFLVRPIPVPSKFASSPGVPLRGLRLLSLAMTLWDFRAGRAIRRELRKFRPDIVHLNERSLLHAAWVCRRSGVPVVMHARNVADRKTRWVHRFSVWALRSLADAVIAIDGSVRHSLREVEHCRIVYNPADLGWRKVKARSETGNSCPPASLGRRTRFLYLSVLREFKGIWDFLEAVRLLRERSDMEFLIAGGNSRSPEFYERPLSRIAALLGYAPNVERKVKEFIRVNRLDSSVRFVGHVSDVETLFDRVDVNVFPSWLNGPSRSIFECGMFAIPSILALRDRVEDVVENQVTGLIVPDKSPEELARAIIWMADNPHEREKMGLRAKKRYDRQFNPRQCAAQVLETYRRLLSVPIRV